MYYVVDNSIFFKFGAASFNIIPIITDSNLKMPWQTTHAQRVYPWKFSTGVRTLSSAIGRNLHETIIDYRERREENSSAIKSPRKTSRRGNGRKGRVITGPNPSWAPEITTSTHLARRSGLYTPSQSLDILPCPFKVQLCRENFSFGNLRAERPPRPVRESFRNFIPSTGY